MGAQRGARDPGGAWRVREDVTYLRPLDIDELRGDARKIKAAVGWEARTTWGALCDLMVRADLDALKRGGA
jgi:GDP-D-mannose dehydratase